ncbi:MAG TPA: patatin-like phospholipase family protein [Gemmatimonadota bacterium]|nr:patatin-like phospholipase family protein [Gemmatimonadota bacterium]
MGQPRRIAAKFLGGFVPAVAYHFGVLEVLEGRGFRLRKGFLEAGEKRETGAPGIDFVIGSSAGAFFTVAACAGADRRQIAGTIEENVETAPFQARYLGQGKGLTRKTWDYLRSGVKPSWKGRRTWKAWAAESTLNALFPLWSLDAIDHYLADDVLKGRDWADLRTEAAVLAVDLNHPVTFVLGERESPILELLRDEPVDPEAIHRILGSEGWKIVTEFVAAGVAPDHAVLAPFRAEPWARHTTVYVRGVPMSRAAAGSMAAYPFYAPVELQDEDGRSFRIGHYTPVVIDGEDRDPFTTDVAEQSGADLVFVSSISTPYKYLHSVGSLARLGFPELHAQKATQSRDAKQENAARAQVMNRRLFDEGRRVLERAGCGEEAVEELHAAFQRLAWVDHVRIRITPDPDLAVESRLLRRLDPLSFTPQAVDRAFDLGRRVAERVLRRYSFEFL